MFFLTIFKCIRNKQIYNIHAKAVVIWYSFASNTILFVNQTMQNEMFIKNNMLAIGYSDNIWSEYYHSDILNLLKIHLGERL